MRTGKGRELLFLHGWGLNKDVFAPADNLKGFTVTRVDLFGFGESPHPPYPIELDNYVNAVKRLMSYYNMENVIVVGHSFGGRIAIKLASYSRVSAIVLVDAAGLKPRRNLSYYVKVFSYKICKFFKKPIVAGSDDYQACKGALKGTFVNIVNEHLDKTAAKIDCPTLVLWGKNDKQTPLYMYKRFLKLIRNSKGVLLDGDHFVFAEQSKRFYTLVKQFAIDVENDLGNR